MIPAHADTSANFRRLAARIRGLVGKAIADDHMIGEDDRVMVCLSGGKDSYTLLDMLLSLQRAAPVAFELFAVNLDQKQPGFPETVLPDYLRSLGVPFQVIEQDTYAVVRRVIPEGRTQCGLCSRLRRGALYRFARARGFPIIPCTLCGSQPNLQRAAIARMLADWERESPGRVDSIFSALCNVEASHLADPRAFDFAGLAQRPPGAGA